MVDSIGTIAGAVADTCGEIAFFGDDIVPEVGQHAKPKIPEREERVHALTERYIARTPYYPIAKLQEYAEPHLSKKISLSVCSLLATAVQNLAQVFQLINSSPNFTNVVNNPVFALGFLIFGSITSALSFVLAAYSSYKAVVFDKRIDELAAAQAKLGTADRSKKEIYQITQNLLELERNKAIRNVVISVASIAVFILGNTLGMGIPLMIVIGCCILLVAIKLYKDLQATAEAKKLCKVFQDKFSIVSYGSGLYDPEFKKLMALVIPVIQRETGFDFEDQVMSYVQLVHRSHVA